MIESNKLPVPHVKALENYELFLLADKNEKIYIFSFTIYFISE